MSERDEHSQEAASQTPQPSDDEQTGPAMARVRRTAWRGWIWAVPLAALILVGYLVIRNWLLAGPTVTVRFPSAEGLSPKGTPVRYKGVQVGSVDGVHLTDDLSAVVVTLSMEGSVSDSLRSGTKFWIVKPDLTSGNLGNLLSGGYIAMEPGDGKQMTHFQGLLQPPTLEPDEPGHTFVLYAERTKSIAQGTPLLYRGLEAGKVIGVSYADEQDRIHIKVFVRKPFDQLVRDSSQFWRCGGLNVSTQGGAVGIDVPPVRRLLQGCITFGTLRHQDAAVANTDTTFRLYDSEQAARSAFTGEAVRFLIYFPGSVAGLQSGSPVELKGIPVGNVREVSLQYDQQQENLTIPVIIELYPERLKLAGAPTTMSAATTTTTTTASTPQPQCRPTHFMK